MVVVIIIIIGYLFGHKYHYENGKGR